MIKYNGLSTLEVLEGADNYNKWIADVVRPNTSSPVLEVGAGIGNITQHLLSHSRLFVTDIDSGLVGQLAKRFSKNKNVKNSVLDITKPPPEKFKNFFSSILAVNVLEHINDDKKALGNLKKMLKKNGSLTLLVPAKKIAYTRLDKELGHFRRYEKNGLEKLISESGFTVDEIFYFNIVGLLSWMVRDKLERTNINMKPYQIALFDSIVPILKILEMFVRPPIGISLIVYARKK